MRLFFQVFWHDQNDANNNGLGDACDTGDSDLENMPDDYEYRLNLQAGVHDGLKDNDGDGETNINERNADSVMRFFSRG